MEERIRELDGVIAKIVRRICAQLYQFVLRMAVEEAIREDELDSRQLRGASCRCAQDQRVDMGLARTALDHLDTREVWYASIRYRNRRRS